MKQSKDSYCTTNSDDDCADGQVIEEKSPISISNITIKKAPDFNSIEDPDILRQWCVYLHKHAETFEQRMDYLKKAVDRRSARINTLEMDMDISDHANNSLQDKVDRHQTVIWDLEKELDASKTYSLCPISSNTNSSSFSFSSFLGLFVFVFVFVLVMFIRDDEVLRRL